MIVLLVYTLGFIKYYYMKIVNVIGGLGNQMFQYAFALALQQRWPTEDIMIDISHFKHFFVKKIGAANLHNGYEIDNVFPNACLPVATAKQIRKVSRYIPNYVLSRVARRLLPTKKTEIIQPIDHYFAYNPSILDVPGDCYYEGIWESVQFINPVRAKVQECFSHPSPSDDNAEIIKRMHDTNSVGIHIRRGDYLRTESFSGICGIEYYKKAIFELLSDGVDHTFFIFSNDIPWCEANILPLLGDNHITLVTHNFGDQSCWDMFLMTHCQDLIIANSSFSWWGAFLNNRRGRVIAPDRWANRDAAFDIWLPDWIRINN